MDVRVVSLVPSSTETLLALGADIVACTRFCEQPSITHVGGTKNPDLEAIASLRPDLVVLDREENRVEDHDALVAAGIAVFVSDVRSLDAGMAVVADLAKAVGIEPPTTPEIPVVEEPSRRRAFVPIWRRPWMTIGPATYGASVLAHLGVELVPAENRDDYPTVELDAIASEEPDVILVPSEPYVFTDTHLSELRAQLPGSRVERVDGRDLFWWGIRSAPAVTRLATRIGSPGFPDPPTP